MPQLRAATESDLHAIGDYLASKLKPEPARYRRFFQYPWMREKPNLGYLIEDAGRIRGFLGAIYARRELPSGSRMVCNINSWAVDDEHRQLGLMLAKKLLDQKGMAFTCFTPSVRVVELLTFFKFETWSSEKVLFPIGSGLGRLTSVVRTGLIEGAELRRTADPKHAAILDDHANYHLACFALERGDRRCYVIAGRRGKGAKVFADVLYASDPALLVESVVRAHVHLARVLRTPIIGIDARWIERVPRDTLTYRKLRPLQYRGIALAELDTLYSELVPILG